MKSPKFYKLIITALVIINLGTLAFFWLSKPPHPPKAGEGPKLSEQLELRGEAKSKVDALEKEHHKTKKVLMHKDRQLHQKLFECVGEEKDVEPILNELNENKEEIERMTFEFFDAVASHCDDQQKKKLRDDLQKRLHNLFGPPPPPRKWNN